jgi:hypothetical protein
MGRVAAALLLLLTATPVNADDGFCKNQTDCPSYDLCVTVSPTWSQCVDCSNFQVWLCFFLTCFY